jgi:ribonuclease J
VAGRSLDRIIEVGKASGYLKDFPTPVDFETAMGLPRGELLIIATGGQGEPRAALGRITEGNHQLSLEAGDVVLFSSRQIPGNEIPIGRIQNRLAERDIKLVTDRQSLIHVSGHPGRPDLEALYAWIRPEILIPVHGEIRHMREQARFGVDCGIPTAVFQQNGDLVRLAPGKPGKIDMVHTGRLVLDGDMIVPADGDAVVMRRRLSQVGVVTVAVDPRGGVQVDAMGLPIEVERHAFLAETRTDVESALAAARKARAEPDKLREAARLAARRAASRWTGKKPQVIVMMAQQG